MKYDHVLWDSILKILQYGKERLMKRGNTVMCAEVDRVYQSAINNFTMPLNQLAWALSFICKEQGILPPVGSDNLTEDEKEAVRAEDLKAVSSKEGIKAVKIAHERLLEAEKMRPVTEAKEKLDRAKETVESKQRVLKAQEEERDRPAAELAEAEKDLKKATSELKTVEKAVAE